MYEKDTIKLIIKHEYEEEIKNKWDKQKFVDYLLNKYAELRTQQVNGAVEICVNCDKETETHSICSKCFDKIINENKKTDNIADVSGSEFQLIVQASLNLAFEAGKWEGQVELEEHYDREQYSQVLAEAINSRKTSSPADLASNGRTVRVNLRSQAWRDGVRNSAKEYLEKAMLLVRAHYR